MAPSYYKLDVGKIPDDLYHAEVPVEKWLSLCQTADSKEGFPVNSLGGDADPIPFDVEAERVVGIALWMFMNIFPFIFVPLVLMVVVPGLPPFVRHVAIFAFGYVAVLTALELIVFRPWFGRKYKLKDGGDSGVKSSAGGVGGVRSSQYIYTERNITKYLSMKFVWPQSMHRPAMESTPVIFAVVPHGVAPLGITAYPLWSKLWNNRLCHWTAAPIVLKIPLIKILFSAIGYIPAKSKNILETLTKKEENVGIILDGIAGMFHVNRTEETAYLTKRKGIVKIALRAGTPIVPVYGFGHTSMWTVVVDPFGILERLSSALEASLVPFFGRFGWFLGPPRRVPVTVCLGEPVLCPKVDEPTQDQIDEYHGKLLKAYQELFDTHKKAYGWGDKRLVIV